MYNVSNASLSINNVDTAPQISLESYNRAATMVIQETGMSCMMKKGFPSPMVPLQCALVQVRPRNVDFVRKQC